MTKFDLVNNLHRMMFGGNRLTRATIEELLEALGGEARSALARGEKVFLPGIGKLCPKQRAARKGRNPRTGEPVTIPACTVVAFKHCKKLTDAIKG